MGLCKREHMHNPIFFSDLQCAMIPIRSAPGIMMSVTRLSFESW